MKEVSSWNTRTGFSRVQLASRHWRLCRGWHNPPPCWRALCAAGTMLLDWARCRPGAPQPPWHPHHRHGGDSALWEPLLYTKLPPRCLWRPDWFSKLYSAEAVSSAVTPGGNQLCHYLPPTDSFTWRLGASHPVPLLGHMLPSLKTIILTWPLLKPALNKHKFKRYTGLQSMFWGSRFCSYPRSGCEPHPGWLGYFSRMLYQNDLFRKISLFDKFTAKVKHTCKP